ncbi:Gp49 family protein [Ewingella sp. AOP9-I1-14]
MSDKDIELEIQAKGKTAPRVTSEHIQSVIATEHYFTAGQAIRNGGITSHVYVDADAGKSFVVGQSVELLTFCVLVLRNGFTVTGESACASPENFDAEIGRKIARENAVQKIWALEGYRLKQVLFEEQ